MGRRIRLPLENPTEEEILKRDPLQAFSFYLAGRNDTLLDTADEIIECLNNGFLEKSVKANFVGQASTLMWFWTLGAYEVIRTISQGKECFSDSFNSRISKLKDELAKVRMPNSKMEKRGQRSPVTSNRSPDGWNLENKDLLVGDPDNAISARGLLQLYEDVMFSLEIGDVKKHHSDSY